MEENFSNPFPVARRREMISVPPVQVHQQPPPPPPSGYHRSPQPPQPDSHAFVETAISSSKWARRKVAGGSATGGVIPEGIARRISALISLPVLEPSSDPALKSPAPRETPEPALVTLRRAGEVIQTAAQARAQHRLRRELDEINDRVKKSMAEYNSLLGPESLPGAQEEEDEAAAQLARRNEVRLMLTDYNRLSKERTAVLIAMRTWFENLQGSLIDDSELLEKEEIGLVRDALRIMSDMSDAVETNMTIRDRLAEVWVGVEARIARDNERLLQRLNEGRGVRPGAGGADTGADGEAGAQDDELSPAGNLKRLQHQLAMAEMDRDERAAELTQALKAQAAFVAEKEREAVRLRDEVAKAKRDSEKAVAAVLAEKDEVERRLLAAEEGKMDKGTKKAMLLMLRAELDVMRSQLAAANDKLAANKSAGEAATEERLAELEAFYQEKFAGLQAEIAASQQLKDEHDRLQEESLRWKDMEEIFQKNFDQQVALFEANEEDLISHHNHVLQSLRRAYDDHLRGLSERCGADPAAMIASVQRDYEASLNTSLSKGASGVTPKKNFSFKEMRTSPASSPREMSTYQIEKERNAALEEQRKRLEGEAAEVLASSLENAAKEWRKKMGAMALALAGGKVKGGAAEALKAITLKGSGTAAPGASPSPSSAAALAVPAGPKGRRKSSAQFHPPAPPVAAVSPTADALDDDLITQLLEQLPQSADKCVDTASLEDSLRREQDAKRAAEARRLVEQASATATAAAGAPGAPPPRPSSPKSGKPGGASTEHAWEVVQMLAASHADQLRAAREAARTQALEEMFRKVGHHGKDPHILAKLEAERYALEQKSQELSEQLADAHARIQVHKKDDSLLAFYKARSEALQAELEGTEGRVLDAESKADAALDFSRNLAADYKEALAKAAEAEAQRVSGLEAAKASAERRVGQYEHILNRIAAALHGGDTESLRQILLADTGVPEQVKLRSTVLTSMALGDSDERVAQRSALEMLQGSVLGHAYECRRALINLRRLLLPPGDLGDAGLDSAEADAASPRGLYEAESVLRAASADVARIFQLVGGERERERAMHARLIEAKDKEITEISSRAAEAEDLRTQLGAFEAEARLLEEKIAEFRADAASMAGPNPRRAEELQPSLRIPTFRGSKPASPGGSRSASPSPYMPGGSVAALGDLSDRKRIRILIRQKAAIAREVSGLAAQAERFHRNVASLLRLEREDLVAAPAEDAARGLEPETVAALAAGRAHILLSDAFRMIRGSIVGANTKLLATVSAKDSEIMALRRRVEELARLLDEYEPGTARDQDEALHGEEGLSSGGAGEGDDSGPLKRSNRARKKQLAGSSKTKEGGGGRGGGGRGGAAGQASAGGDGAGGSKVHNRALALLSQRLAESDAVKGIVSRERDEALMALRDLQVKNESLEVELRRALAASATHNLASVGSRARLDDVSEGSERVRAEAGGGTVSGKSDFDLAVEADAAATREALRVVLEAQGLWIARQDLALAKMNVPEDMRAAAVAVEAHVERAGVVLSKVALAENTRLATAALAARAESVEGGLSEGDILESRIAVLASSQAEVVSVLRNTVHSRLAEIQDLRAQIQSDADGLIGYKAVLSAAEAEMMGAGAGSDALATATHTPAVVAAGAGTRALELDFAPAELAATGMAPQSLQPHPQVTAPSPSPRRQRSASSAASRSAASAAPPPTAPASAARHRSSHHLPGISVSVFGAGGEQQEAVAVPEAGPPTHHASVWAPAFQAHGLRVQAQNAFLSSAAVALGPQEQALLELSKSLDDVAARVAQTQRDVEDGKLEAPSDYAAAFRAITAITPLQESLGRQLEAVTAAVQAHESHLRESRREYLDNVDDFLHALADGAAPGASLEGGLVVAGSLELMDGRGGLEVGPAGTRASSALLRPASAAPSWHGSADTSHHLHVALEKARREGEALRAELAMLRAEQEVARIESLRLDRPPSLAHPAPGQPAVTSTTMITSAGPSRLQVAVPSASREQAHHHHQPSPRTSARATASHAAPRPSLREAELEDQIAELTQELEWARLKLAGQAESASDSKQLQGLISKAADLAERRREIEAQQRFLRVELAKVERELSQKPVRADRMDRALLRMAARHRKALEEWGARKEAILREREENLDKTMTFMKDIHAARTRAEVIAQFIEEKRRQWLLRKHHHEVTAAAALTQALHSTMQAPPVTPPVGYRPHLHPHPVVDHPTEIRNRSLQVHGDRPPYDTPPSIPSRNGLGAGAGGGGATRPRFPPIA